MGLPDYAYPAVVEEHHDGARGLFKVHYGGMSRLDWLTGQALQGLCVGVDLDTYDRGKITAAALDIAKRQLKRLENQ